MKLIETRQLYQERYTELKETRYVDDRGQPHTWTFIERRLGQQAVVVIPLTEKSRTLILIRQFRVPFRRDVIEFPAGLADPGETPEQTAVRELLEETGYRGRIDSVGPAVSTSAGITTECVHIVRMTVGESPERAQALEGSEAITVLRVPRGGEAELLSRAVADGVLLDAKVYTYLSQMIERSN